MSDNTKNYAFLPEIIIRDKQLNPISKLLYGEITALCDENGYYSINNNHLSELYGTSKESISRGISLLESKGYIKKDFDIEIVKKLKNKNFTGLGLGNCICEWCNIKTIVLHQHHYPVTKSMGGKDTVKICPNCHHEFHFSKKIKLNLTKDELEKVLLERSNFNV
jgi:hypothetical protein